MPRKISDVLSVSPKALKRAGVFNGFVDLDTQFYIDPCLLRHSSAKELASSYANFKEYFEGIIRLLVASPKIGVRFKKVVDKLIFHEIELTAIGYTESGINGKGIGLELARGIASRAREIIREGIKDPVFFELMGLFVGGIGADRISDMTTCVIFEDLLRFSKRVTKKLKVEAKNRTLYDGKYSIPFDSVTKRPILLLPMDILCNLPVAYGWGDGDLICPHNVRLRKKVNKIIGDTWKQATRKINKQKLWKTLIKNPDVLRDLIKQYTAKEAGGYDFDRDPLGEIVWYDIARRFSSEHPLKLKVKSYRKIKEIEEVIEKICQHFGRLVESKGLWASLYDGNGNLRHERYVHRLFYGIADSYCEANKLKLDIELNAGRGSVDFKISRARNLRIVVEVKYTSNSQLVTGYTRRLPEYQRAERTTRGFYIVIRTTDSESPMERLREIHRESLLKRALVPKIVSVDGRKQVSASNS